MSETLYDKADRILVEVTRLKAERDELLEALEGVLEHIRQGVDNWDAVKRARELVARIRGTR